MRNIFLVALREYLENARTKGFWLGIFILPCIIVLSIQVPIFLEKRASPVRHFVLLDQSEQFSRIIEDALAGSAQDGGPGEDRKSPSYQRVDFPEAAGDLPEAAERLRPYLRGERRLTFNGRPVKLDAAILIPRDFQDHVLRPGGQPVEGKSGVEFWSANLADRTLRNLVQNAMNQEVRRREFLAHGLDVDLFRSIEQTRLPLIDLNPKKERGEERVTVGESITHWAPIGFVYLLWVSIFSISQMLLSSTIEEKSNRVIEVLLSSLRPAEFVLGKLAGIAAVGLTMVSAWLLSVLIIVGWTSSGGQSEAGAQFLNLLTGSTLVPSFVVYFVFGYLLYAGLILAVGSVCNTLKEAQNYMAVITLLMTVPLLTMVSVVKNPNGPLAMVLSWIPFYTPFVMLNRAAAGPPWYEILGTMLVLVASTTLVLWGAVKIFHTGILRTGQPPRLIEILRWLRAN